MQITGITLKPYTPLPNTTKNNKFQQTQYSAPQVQKSYVYYPYISFAGKTDGNKKNLDPEDSTKKLLKLFDDLLVADMDGMDLMQLYETHIMTQMMQKKQRLQSIAKKTDELQESTLLTNIEKKQYLNSLKKELNLLQKNLGKFEPFVPPKPLDPDIDTVLVNRFKTAVVNDNLNLDKVYQDYYSGLTQISDTEELREKYPKIKLPSRPEDVVSEKIVSCLTREFYETMDKLMRRKDIEGIYNLCDNKVKEIVKASTNNPHVVYRKCFEPAVTLMLDKYEKLRDTNTFSTVPQFRKNQNVHITENDVKLLLADYDDYVLSVLRQQYLEGKKTNEITYSNEFMTINLSSLHDRAYKFEKPSERIKCIINTARQIQIAKRDYENFSTDKLRASLNKSAESKIANNEDIFNRIVSFDSCKFEPGDKKAMIRFLQIIDDLKDGRISEQEAVRVIQTEDLRPSETEKINEDEKKRIVETLRLQQEQTVKLNYLRSRFDSAINDLYSNNLNGIALICSKYRPEDLTSVSAENAEFLIKTIESSDFSDTASLKTKIKNWDTYNSYKSTDPDGEIFRKALAYAAASDGEVDEQKAGRFLVNSSIVMSAPQSYAYMEDKEKDLIENIIDRSASQEDAIKYLCKYSEYKELDTYQKTHLQSYIDNFNMKDSIDKYILKSIVENDYVNVDTTSTVELNDSDTTEATISSKAKKQILGKYMFPGCMEFMYAFEKALTNVSGDWGTSGIKKITKNNKALEYRMELKLVNHDDRLFASEKDYYFDVFSDKGLH